MNVAPPTERARWPVLLLAGPTASGKSSVALELARRLGGEILSADSMQVYRGLDLGTAKPTPAERAAIPHHLVDLVGCDEPFDAARWLDGAVLAIADIMARGRVAVIVGGTGLYFRAWWPGLDAPGPVDTELRAILESTSLEVLLAELAERDPATWERIDRRNPRRVVRAVEILRSPGSGSRPRAGGGEDGPAPTVHALQREPGDLRRRIEERVDRMFAAGLVAETRALMTQGLASNRTALQAIGYRQVVEHLRGERDLPATVALVKVKTWQYARRQMTWFRRHPGVRFLEVHAGEAPEVTAGRLLERWHDR